MNTKKVMSAVTAAILLTQLTANSFNLVEAAPKEDKDNQGHCYTAGENFVKDDQANDGFSVTAPEGKVFTSVFVKAGSDQSTDDNACTEYTVNGDDGKYKVSGLGTATVTVVKVGEGPAVKDISHIEGVYADVVEDDDDDTTPVDEDDDTTTDDDQEEDVVEDDDTTTDDDTEEEVVVEEEEVVENTEATEGEVLGVANETAKQGEVAGATEMADTGVSLAMLSQIGQAIAVAVLARNAVKKDKRQ